MSRSGIVAASSIIILAAGGLYLGLSGTDELGNPIEVIEKPLENSVAGQAVELENGKKLRMAMLANVDTVLVEDTEVGRVGLHDVSDVSPESLCSLLVVGNKTTVEKLYGDERKGDKRETPNLESLKGLMGKTSWPVLIDGSCGEKGVDCVWNWLLQGQDCVTVAQSGSYLASSMAEALNLQEPWKSKVLRAYVKVTLPDGQESEIMVPVNDPRVTDESKVILPHSWAGADYINFGEGKKSGGEVVKYDQAAYANEVKEIPVAEPVDVKPVEPGDDKPVEPGGDAPIEPVGDKPIEP
jgi:hypothetical protein